MRELSLKGFIVLIICACALKLALPPKGQGQWLTGFFEGRCSYVELIQALGRGDYSEAVEAMELAHGQGMREASAKPNADKSTAGVGNGWRRGSEAGY